MQNKFGAVNRNEQTLTMTDDGSDNWIVDAKYSYYNSLPANADIHYRDQMFRYLFLTSKEQAENQNTHDGYQFAKTPWAQHLALVYTTDQEVPLRDSGQSVQSIWLDSWGQDRPKLYQFAVKFPSREDVQSLDTWESYSLLLTAQLQQTLGL